MRPLLMDPFCEFVECKPELVSPLGRHFWVGHGKSGQGSNKSSPVHLAWPTVHRRRRCCEILPAAPGRSSLGRPSVVPDYRQML